MNTKVLQKPRIRKVLDKVYYSCRIILKHLLRTCYSSRDFLRVIKLPLLTAKKATANIVQGFNHNICESLYNFYSLYLGEYIALWIIIPLVIVLFLLISSGFFINHILQPLSQYRTE